MINERESFLLARSDQQGAVYLDAVDIDGVLVERTAANVVLRTEFVGLTHTGEGDEQTLDRSTGSIGHDAGGGGIYLVHRSLGAFETAYLYLGEQLFVGKQLNVDIEHVMQIDDTLLDGGIADHGVGEDYRVRFVHDEFVKAVLVRRCTERSVGIENHHIRQLNTYVVLIDHVTVDTGVASKDRQTARTQEQKVYYF